MPTSPRFTISNAITAGLTVIERAGGFMEAATLVRGGQGDPEAYRNVQNYVVNSATREVIHTPPPADVPPSTQAGAWLRDEATIHPTNPHRPCLPAKL